MESICTKLKLVHLAVEGQVIANFSDHVLLEALKTDQDIIWFNQAGHWQADKNSVFHQSGHPVQQEISEHGVTAPGQNHVMAPDSLPGAHNMQNLAAALTVVETMGLHIPQLDEVLSSFAGLPHRLEFVGEKAGVRYINDSISTTPVSVAAALQTTAYKNVVLLLGGMDRGLDWNGFAASLLDRTPYAIITQPDSGPRIFNCLKEAGLKPEGGLHAVSGLKQAMALAQQLVPDKGCILLSPGAPSFPHFRDYEDRGDQFRRLAGLD